LKKTRKIKVSTKLSDVIKNECANYYEGNCVLLDTACVQIDSPNSLAEGTVLCKYCDSVLLATHPELKLAIHSDSSQKICLYCKDHFFPKNNRQEYCDNCAALRKRQTKAAWIREKRFKNSAQV
jgi:uncharacterized Zn-finger protein